MTNLEIIINEAVLNKIYTEEEIMEIMETTGDLKINTFATWKAKGYKVKKGEHARIVTRLWKHKSRKEVTEDNEEITLNNMYLVKAFLFTADQVERIGA